MANLNNKAEQKTLANLRSEVIRLAGQLNQLAYTLDPESAPYLVHDIDQIVRQANLPVAVEEWLHCESLRAFGARQCKAIFED